MLLNIEKSIAVSELSSPSNFTAIKAYHSKFLYLGVHGVIVPLGVTLSFVTTIYGVHNLQ